jgi:hypothetical protein
MAFEWVLTEDVWCQKMRYRHDSAIIRTERPPRAVVVELLEDGPYRIKFNGDPYEVSDKEYRGICFILYNTDDGEQKFIAKNTSGVVSDPIQFGPIQVPPKGQLFQAFRDRAGELYVEYPYGSNCFIWMNDQLLRAASEKFVTYKATDIVAAGYGRLTRLATKGE